ncbi:MAG: aldo/keto reductase [Thermoproteota archaeon]
MKYRRFGKLDWQVSALGFGCMRLPIIGNDHSKVDEPEAIRMIRYAIDHGVNYVDTAYPYHGGNGEIVVGKALRDGYRERVRLATKMPIWNINSREDMDRIFEEQLKKLQTEYVDFYLLHALNKNSWLKIKNLNVFDWAERVVSEDRIKHLGFSFHDDFEVFKEIIDAYKWTLCQIQYNYENEEVQAGTRGLKYAAGKGLAVVIMEPLLGGALANPPPAVKQIWDEAGKDPVEMALQWLWNKPEVSVVLSGMSTMDQVKRNIEFASRSGVGILSDEDLKLIARVHMKYRELRPIPCTRCGYCMPCPNGVDIPENFEVYNHGVAYNTIGAARRVYNNNIPAERRASACVGCRTCEEKCPQKIKISEWMQKVDKELRFQPPGA